MTFKVILPLGKTLFTNDADAVAATTYPDLASAEKAVTDMITAEQKDLDAAGTTLAASSDATTKKVGAYLKEEAVEVGHLLGQKFAPTMDGKGSLFITRRGIIQITPVA